MQTPFLSRLLHNLADRHTASVTRHRLNRLGNQTRRDIGLPPLGPAPRNPVHGRLVNDRSRHIDRNHVGRTVRFIAFGKIRRLPCHGSPASSAH